ncbi:9306_t:CDS:2 [Racocetra fulgida]|uniref:9306_t:CDS:1 n=1 Tax=Racocetra fulgida TaxID=60492 RepID=A0A9N8ZNK3_9GLOM|nr:9306_t:CDS:2 [Racocetra fulgida]
MHKGHHNIFFLGTRILKIQNYIKLNAITRVKRPFASHYSTEFKPKTLYSSPSSFPPEPPIDPLPTPPPEPAGVNNPIDSLPPLDKTCSSITFRIPTDREQLEQIFTPRLYDRYISEFDKIEKEKSTIKIELLKIYGLGIRDIWFTIAPKKVITNREYNIIQWMTSKIALTKISEGMSNIERKSRISFSAAKNYASVINFKVDIEVDADSPYFEPTEKISKSADGHNDITLNWNWRVGDIDYLLEKEDLENKGEK